MDKKIELLSRGFQSKANNSPFPNSCSTNNMIVCEDPQSSSDERYQEVDFENVQLHRKITALERELNCRSPSKTRKPKSRNVLESSRNSNLLGRESDVESALLRMDQLKLADNINRFPSHSANSTSGSGGSGSPVKKQRKMATRKWDLAPEDQI